MVDVENEVQVGPRAAPPAPTAAAAAAAAACQVLFEGVRQACGQGSREGVCSCYASSSDVPPS